MLELEPSCTRMTHEARQCRIVAIALGLDAWVPVDDSDLPQHHLDHLTEFGYPA